MCCKASVSKVNPADTTDEKLKLVSLGKAIQTTYRYEGIRRLRNFTILCFVTIMIPALHIGNVYEFKNSVVESFSVVDIEYPDGSTQTYNLYDVRTNEEAVEYMVNWLSSKIKKTLEKNENATVVTYDEDYEIAVAELGYYDMNETFMAKPECKFDVAPMDCFVQSSTWTFFLSKDLKEDLKLLAKLKHQVPSTKQAGKRFFSTSWFIINDVLQQETMYRIDFKRSTRSLFRQKGNILERFVAYHFSYNVYGFSFSQIMKLVFDLSFIAFTTLYFIQEINQQKLSKLQSRNSKFCECNGWNVIDWSSITISFFLIALHWYLVFTKDISSMNRQEAIGICASKTGGTLIRDWTLSEISGSGGKCHPVARSYGFALFYAYGINSFIHCLRLFKYMRFHSGLKVYTNLFSIAMKKFIDFSVWFTLMIGSFSVTLTICYGLAGTNRDFSSLLSTMVTVIKLIFGFYDMETFINNGKGLGGGLTKAIPEMLFWLTVIMGIVIAQNIMLAIIVEAYDIACKEREEKGER